MSAVAHGKATSEPLSHQVTLHPRKGLSNTVKHDPLHVHTTHRGSTSQSSRSLPSPPAELHQRPQWIVWRSEDGRKTPYQPHTGRLASTTEPSHWTGYDEARAAYVDAAMQGSPYSGLGFVFTPGDPLCGIDLDDCRDPATGDIAPWAREIIDRTGTYTEVSPSQTGVKLYGLGEVPHGRGRQVEYGGGKIEVYDRGRYFAYTGDVLGEVTEVINVQGCLDTLAAKLFERGHERADGSTAPLDVPDQSDYVMQCNEDALAALDDSVSGSRGSDKLIRALCEIRRMQLNEEQSWELIEHFNATKCYPPWGHRDLTRKWNDAKRMTPLDNAEDLFDAIDEGGAVGADAIGKAADGPGRRKDRTERLRAAMTNVVDIETANYEQHYLADNLLVAGKPFVVAGMGKTLKTGLTTDIAFSLAAGTPAFGNDAFKVDGPKRVAFFTAESGGAVIQNRLRRLREARGVELGDFEPQRFQICTAVPRLWQPQDYAYIRDLVEGECLDACIVDPAYLSLYSGGEAEGAANLGAVGKHLERFAEIGDETDCAMVTVHHFAKSALLKAKQWPKLNDMSGSGFAEYFRGWMLIGRVKDMEGGTHELKVHIGGSDGQGDNWHATIDEGYVDFKRGSKWDVTFRRAGEDPAAGFGDAASLIGDTAADRAAVSGKLLAIPRVIREIEAAGVRATSYKIRCRLGINGSRAKQRLGELVDAGLIAMTTVTTPSGESDVYTCV